jgi:hypothetical protein
MINKFSAEKLSGKLPSSSLKGKQARNSALFNVFHPFVVEEGSYRKLSSKLQLHFHIMFEEFRFMFVKNLFFFLQERS